MSLVRSGLKMFKTPKDLMQQMKATNVCPEPSMINKYNYFYEGYNKGANTQKHMSFDEKEAPTLPFNDIWGYNLLK